MNAFSYSKICFPITGSLCLLQGVHQSAGILSILYIVGGAWMIGINLFEIDLESVGPSGIFLLTALALVGAGAWIWHQWGGQEWLLAYFAGVIWIFTAIGFLLTIRDYRALGKTKS